MQAMHYSVGLPADYEMEIIRRRVRDRGAMTDHLGGLALKAYCVSDAARTGQANSYAPFYLWNASQSMAEFLLGDPFAGLSASFGRPRVEHWLGVAFSPGPDLGAQPISATRQLELIAPGSDLRMVRQAETERSRTAAQSPAAHCHAVAIDPLTWQLVRFALWSNELDAHNEEGVACYEVLHLSRPGLAELA